jgi:hypothetical protein
MRILPICLLAAVIAAPAFAQEKTTLEYMTTKGSVLKVGGMEFPTTYTPDGKFSAADGQVTGTWRIAGETLCVTTNYDPNEACTLYPSGKKPGDEFEITSPQGTVTILINK